MEYVLPLPSDISVPSQQASYAIGQPDAIVLHIVDHYMRYLDCSKRRIHWLVCYSAESIPILPVGNFNRMNSHIFVSSAL